MGRITRKPSPPTNSPYLAPIMQSRNRGLTDSQITEQISALYTTPDSSLITAISMAVGRASTCWIGGTGDREFDTIQAKEVVLELAEWILERYSRDPRLDEQFEVKVKK